MTEGFVQVAADSSTGKRISNLAVTLPAGTAVTDDAGNVTHLAAATTVFVQRVVLSDSQGNVIDDLPGRERWDEAIELLTFLCRAAAKSSGLLFPNR